MADDVSDSDDYDMLSRTIDRTGFEVNVAIFDYYRFDKSYCYYFFFACHVLLDLAYYYGVSAFWHYLPHQHCLPCFVVIVGVASV